MAALNRSTRSVLAALPALFAGAACNVRVVAGREAGLVVLDARLAADLRVPRGDTVLEVRRGSVPEAARTAIGALAAARNMNASCTRYFMQSDTARVVVAYLVSGCDDSRPTEDGDAVASVEVGGRVVCPPVGGQSIYEYRIIDID
jgi:hypothetical protein